MNFSEFLRYQPRGDQNVFVFVCDDAFLIEESLQVWRAMFRGNWTFERHNARAFEEIPASRLIDDALTPSLFGDNRALLVAHSEKLSKTRVEDLAALQSVPVSSLKIILLLDTRKPADAWGKGFSVIEIDSMKPQEVARWLMDRYKLRPEIARYLVDNAGTELYTLHNEVEKLQTYAGDRAIEVRDVDVLVLRSEQFGPFELDDAVLTRNYKKAVHVAASMLDDGVEPLIILSRLVRVWRQLFVGKGLAGTKSAKDVAAAALFPPWKAASLVSSCRTFEWKQLVLGFRELLYADRAFKTSSPDPRVYFDVLLWKLIA